MKNRRTILVTLGIFLSLLFVGNFQSAHATPPGKMYYQFKVNVPGVGIQSLPFAGVLSSVDTFTVEAMSLSTYGLSTCQALYDALVGSKFGFQAGALTEDIGVDIILDNFNPLTGTYNAIDGRLIFQYFKVNVYRFITPFPLPPYSSFTGGTLSEPYTFASPYTAFWKIKKSACEPFIKSTFSISDVNWAYFGFVFDIANVLTATGITTDPGVTPPSDYITLYATHFSSIAGGMGRDFGALPVELTSFTAKPTNGSILLEWKTATELNNYGFQVEKSISGTVGSTWESIGFVAGNGTCNSPKYYSYEDKNSSSGKVSYRLKQIDKDGKFEYSNIVETLVSTPEKFELKQNSPNPFNPSTVIAYTVASNSDVTLKIYDVLGNEIATLVNGHQEAGNYSVTFDASRLTSGTYFCTLNAGNFTKTMKMNLVK